MAFRSQAKSVSGQDSMSLIDHLAELRMRLIRSILAVALGAAGVLAFYDPVLKFLTKPYRDLCATRPDFNCDGSLFAVHGAVYRIRRCFVQPRVLACVLDSVKSIAIFDFLVRHRS